MNSDIKKIIFFAVILGIAGVAFQYVIRPSNQKLVEHKQRVESKSEKLKQVQKAKAAAKDISEQLAQLEEAIIFFESKLPPTVEIDKVLQDVTLIAQKQGLHPKTIRALNKKTNSGYVEQPLKMELVGNFNSFYSFLLELEKLPRIMKIRELKLDKSQKTEGQVSADFIVSIFFQEANS